MIGPLADSAVMRDAALASVAVAGMTAHAAAAPYAARLNVDYPERLDRSAPCSG